MKQENKKTPTILFAVTLLLAFALLALSAIQTNAYNRAEHDAVFSGPALFGEESSKAREVSVTAAPRSSTWGKIFDLNDEGLTENNYQAYTYDFTVTNNTKDEVSDFTFRLTFSHEAFLSSAWNGALEIHQNTEDGEIVSLVPDLREFVPEDHPLRIVTIDGESLIPMQAGDYLVYYPSTSMNAMEMPIEPFEATTPGIIMYVAIGESIEDSSLELAYTFHRVLTSVPLFWISLIALGLWLIALIIFLITSAQIRKYKERHERDNEIIKSHTVRGGEILKSFKSLENAGEGALYHHERYDGKGYPEGKAGEDIPFIARMICVADSYDAMNTDRVYRKRLTKEQIISELESLEL